MSDEPLTSGQGALWVQPDGPNTQPKYLGCYDIGDVTEPLGDVTHIRCPDPARQGGFKTVSSYQGEPGLVTATITGLLYKAKGYLDSLRCPFTLFAHKASCERRDLFTNYDRTFVMRDARTTQRTWSNLVARQDSDNNPSTLAADLSAEELLKIYAITTGRQGIASTSDLSGVHFCSSEKCADACGTAGSICKYGVVVGPYPAASAAEHGEVWYTEDGGVTWTETVADPFTSAEDVVAAVCFPIDKSTTRILVARGTTDPAAPAEVAYSDDNGATWTTVNVGAVNGQYVLDGEGLFALDAYHIWLVTDDGYIYFSADWGETWTAQEEGVLTSDGWNAIEFADPNYGYAVGDNAMIAKTEDGGLTWTVVTPPTGEAADEVDALAVVDKYRVWTGWSDGVVYFTEDGGTTWTQRALPVALTSITDIAFVNELVGWLTGNKAGPTGNLLRTIDGGYTWQDVSIPTNTGLSMVHPCDENSAFVVGPVVGGTGFVGKVSPQG